MEIDIISSYSSFYEEPIPENNTLLEKMERVAKSSLSGLQFAVEKAKDIACNINPHSFDLSPWVLSRVIVPRIISYGLYGGALCVFASNDESSFKKKAFLTLLGLAGFLDLTGFIPYDLKFRATMDGFFLCSSSLMSCFAMYEGAKQIMSFQKNDRVCMASICQIASGIFSLFYSAYNLFFYLTTTNNLIQGIRTFHTLDKNQQEAVLKFRALPYIAEYKEKRAVLIDGIDYDTWASLDNPAFPAAETLYQHYHTRSYQVDSSYELNQALKDAVEKLGGQIDVIVLFGHANARSQILGPHYDFYGDDEDIDSIRDFLSDRGQLLILGCNTATSSSLDDVPLAQRVSKALPGHQVTGIGAYYNPNLSSNSYNNGVFQAQSYFFLKEGKSNSYSITFPFNAINYIDGQEI